MIGSKELKTFGRSLKSGVTKAVFPEDLKVSDKKVFDPQDKSLLLWNRLFVISCIIAVSIDPLFFYLPIVEHRKNCLGMDYGLAVTTTTLRTMVDAFYLIHMAFQFRTATLLHLLGFFGRGELVIDTKEIAKRYLLRYFIIDFLAVLPLPQIVVLKYLVKARGKGILETKKWLQIIVFAQYIFRFARLLGAMYLFAVERIDTCWQNACGSQGDKCNEDFLYCGNHGMDISETWQNVSEDILGKMCSTYLQSLTVRLEEMRIKRRDSEQWMHHRLLPQVLRERVRRYNQYKWLETRGVDEEGWFRVYQKTLEGTLNATFRLKPSLYTENTFIVREGDPVDEMIFIIRGHLESVTTDGGRSGFYNRGLLKEGDFCGEELLTWALDPKASINLPLSTRTVKALTEVEAFALRAEELKFVAGQFRRLHSKQIAELRRMEETDDDDDDDDDDYSGEEDRLIKPRRGSGSGSGSAAAADGGSSIATTLYASKFARKALRGVHRLRSTSSSTGLSLQKPPEPDFSHID
ncbi:Cyclic nucleotide-gated ion channel 1 [Bienertia sinuspersici]